MSSTKQISSPKAAKGFLAAGQLKNRNNSSPIAATPAPSDMVFGVAVRACENGKTIFPRFEMYEYRNFFTIVRSDGSLNGKCQVVPCRAQSQRQRTSAHAA